MRQTRRQQQRRRPVTPRMLSIQQPALRENIRRFRAIHRSAVLQKFEESERVAQGS